MLKREIMKLKNIKIESEHLLLIPIKQKYKEIIHQEFTDEISLFMIPKPEDDISGIEMFIENSINGIDKGTNLQLVALDKNTLEFIGCVGLSHLHQNNPELGLWIKKKAHGNSYGLESISSLINWARDNINFEYLIYPVDERNYASRRIPEKHNGKIYRQYKELNQKGFELNTIEYRIYK